MAMHSLSFINEKITPSKIVCIGRNYAEHARELGNAVPTTPVVFIKPNSALSDTLLSFHEEALHYETEMCFLIKDNALAGVGLGLDLTKRDLQSRLKSDGLPWERAKSFNGAAVVSDFVALSESDDISSLHFTLTINGELRQSGSVTQMLFSPQALLENCQTFLDFYDGDILMTGTPKGVGEVRNGDVFHAVLYRGDECLLQQEWVAI